MRFWTSDQHLGHRNIILYSNRPFQTIEEMNEAIISRHNAVVKPGDTVYHLGDFSLSKQAVQTYLPRLNGEHHLIAGNHDWVHPCRYKKKHEDDIHKARRMYFEAGFKTIQLTDIVEIGGHTVRIHHMPPYPRDVTPETDVRYKEWRPEDTGGWILHGHVHQHWTKKGMWINVGVDRHDFTPITDDRILELMRYPGDL